MGSLHQNPLAWSSCLNDELTRLQKVSLEVREESNESNGKDDNNDLNDNDDLDLENESVIGKSNSTYSNSKEKLSLFRRQVPRCRLKVCFTSIRSLQCRVDGGMVPMVAMVVP